MYVKIATAVVVFFSCVAMAQPMTAPADSKYPILPDTSGVVGVAYQSQVPKDTDPKLDKMLKQYRIDMKPFKWQKHFYHMQGDLPVYEVTFPSPVVTPTVENNTVYCEYFPAITGKGKRPTIIVLHILGGHFADARTACALLCRKGYNAIMVKLPYYGPRRPEGTPEMMEQIEDPYALGPVIRQAVMDVRRTKDWLKTQSEVDPERIGLMGMSLGGFTAALTSGVDATFKRVAIIVAGGNFAKVLMNPGSPVVHYRNLCTSMGVTEDDLRKSLVSNEPMTFTGRLKNTQIFMINGKQDTVVPYDCAEDFAVLTNACQIWYTGGHTSLMPMMRIMLEYINRHFKDDDWSKPSFYFKKKGQGQIKMDMVIPQKKSAASAQSSQTPRS